MRALLLLPLFAVGCIPAGAVKPAGVKAEPVFAVEYAALVEEVRIDPIKAKEKYDAGLVKLKITANNVEMRRRGQVSIVQQSPPITARGKLEDMRAKPGVVVTIVGRFAMLDGDKITLTDCRLE